MRKRKRTVSTMNTIAPSSQVFSAPIASEQDDYSDCAVNSEKRRDSKLDGSENERKRFSKGINHGELKTDNKSNDCGSHYTKRSTTNLYGTHHLKYNSNMYDDAEDNTESSESGVLCSTLRSTTLGLFQSNGSRKSLKVTQPNKTIMGDVTQFTDGTDETNSDCNDNDPSYYGYDETDNIISESEDQEHHFRRNSFILNKEKSLLVALTENFSALGCNMGNITYDSDLDSDEDCDDLEENTPRMSDKDLQYEKLRLMNLEKLRFNE